ncbi:dephospho-CoA kinase [Paenibacillus yanchengensis]|uniref:Dephospho-CoA kinase n=1 Tax=Paenibacillus yanchengensis TaxID=2035833 RepID=A0ABW4YQY8_9BACL
MIIGLTGGIATGKSTVATMLKQLGAAVVDADQIAREVVEPGKPALEAIASLFGQAILQSDGQLDRVKLGSIVFSDKSKLQQLEAITHPAIREEMHRKIEHMQQHSDSRLIVADIPLLYETKQEDYYKEVLVVYVPSSIQLIRLMERNGMTEVEAKRRIALQMDIEQKRQRATWVIDNSGTVPATYEQVEKFWNSRVLL